MGAAAALGAAGFWALTNLILREQIRTLGGATAQAWRTTVSTLVGLIFLAVRAPGDLLAIPGRTVVILLTSVLLSMVIGDILQFTAVRRLGLALAMPIASCYPLFTLVLAALTLGEAFTVRAAVGALLVIVGVILVALPRRTLTGAAVGLRATSPVGHWTGVAFALASAVCVAGSAALTRVALHDLDILTANMLRLPFSAALCSLISTAQRRQPPWQVARPSILPLCLSGLSGLASGLCYLYAIKSVGASTTATLNAAGPIFGLLGAVIVFQERPTRRNLAGTLLAFLGVVLVV